MAASLLVHTFGVLLVFGTKLCDFNVLNCPEAIRILEGLVFTASVSLERITIMLDYKAVVDMVNKRIDPVLEVGGFIDDMWRRSLSIVSCTFYFRRVNGILLLMRLFVVIFQVLSSIDFVILIKLFFIKKIKEKKIVLNCVIY